MKKYPSEIVEWTRKLRDAQLALLTFNDNDPSNYLDEAHKQETIQRLNDEVIHASNKLEKWSKHYGIPYESPSFD